NSHIVRHNLDGFVVRICFFGVTSFHFSYYIVRGTCGRVDKFLQNINPRVRPLRDSRLQFNLVASRWKCALPDDIKCGRADWLPVMPSTPSCAFARRFVHTFLPSTIFAALKRLLEICPSSRFKRSKFYTKERLYTESGMDRLWNSIARHGPRLPSQTNVLRLGADHSHPKRLLP